MDLLLDSHVVLWAMQDPDQIPEALRERLAASTRLVSVATVWELAIKYHKGKLLLGTYGSPAAFLDHAQAELRFTYVPIDHRCALHSASLPKHHSDPFDRMLVAQAQLLGFRLVSRDKQIDAYDVERIW